MDDAEAGDDSSSDLPELDQIIRPYLLSPSPPKKRPRVDDRNPLHRPFKSPFRTPLKASSDAAANAITPASTSILKAKHGAPAFPERSPISTPAPRRLDRPIRPLPSFGSTSPTKPGSKLDKLQKHHTSLLNTLASLRAQLETTNQALEIEASGTDAELQALIRKWRSTSRDAAEEVFRSMKEKVDAMGGIAGWRRKEAEGRRSWDDADEGRKDQRAGFGGEDGTEVERRQLREENEEEKRLEAEAEEDEEGFTMETMLKGMNIPLEMIGYDKESQGWND
ncbi:MAG: hypothetical protein L6R40_005243 [Gallowayella cf. fulva]|nr:MAG: hypothetical protein L6R40_005243 [Xanthomendoza cf. fulva]